MQGDNGVCEIDLLEMDTVPAGRKAGEMRFRLTLKLTWRGDG